MISRIPQTDASSEKESRIPGILLFLYFLYLHLKPLTGSQTCDRQQTSHNLVNFASDSCQWPQTSDRIINLNHFCCSSFSRFFIQMRVGRLICCFHNPLLPAARPQCKCSERHLNRTDTNEKACGCEALTFSCYVEHPVLHSCALRTAGVNCLNFPSGIKKISTFTCLFRYLFVLSVFLTPTSCLTAVETRLGYGDTSDDNMDESVFWNTKVLPVLQEFESFAPGDDEITLMDVLNTHK